MCYYLFAFRVFLSNIIYILSFCSPSDPGMAVSKAKWSRPDLSTPPRSTATFPDVDSLKPQMPMSQGQTENSRDHVFQYLDIVLQWLIEDAMSRLS